MQQGTTSGHLVGCGLVRAGDVAVAGVIGEGRGVGGGVGGGGGGIVH